MEGEAFTVDDCERCPALCDSRSRIVNGVGPATADVLFVGEAPGEREDEQGEPFVGRSGSVLTDVLRSVGLDRETVRITNAVRCRPPGNRDPTDEELANCREYLDREIRTVDPTVIVPLGKVPSEHLLDRSVAITAEAGSMATIRVGDRGYDVLLCVHPAATLYDPGQRETFESALAEVAAVVGADGSAGGQARLGEFSKEK